MPIFVKGIGLKGYRSFGSTPQFIAPLAQVNVFVGQNNSGKSNVLRLISDIELSRQIPHKGVFHEDALSHHRGKRAAELSILFQLETDRASLEATLKKYNAQLDLHALNQLVAILEKILKNTSRALGTEAPWFEFAPKDWSIKSPIPNTFANVQKSDLGIQITDSEWQMIWHQISNRSGGGRDRHWIPETIEMLNPLKDLNLPQVITIPALRKLGESGSAYEGFGGQGIINRLAELERPNISKYHLKDQFEQINKFLQDVTENESARLEIPSDRSTILVEMDGRTLPIEALGTGIHEVIILASAATAITNSIVCMEEPELHLHPRLQKRLLRYLADETSNQYFISTHSAHLLDAAITSVFHVKLIDGESQITKVLTHHEKSNICHDLGYRPSDLVQTNAVIWVEGPSDRIYLNAWLRQADPSLEEGTDYSIMFYGGRLLSHLSANDPDIDDFISLRRLNRNMAILIDSDRKSEHHKLNGTKRRIRNELQGGPGIVWITHGREIENYIAPRVLEEAVKKVHPQAAKLDSTERFDHALCFRKANGDLEESIDKVAVARAVTANQSTLDRFDLNDKVTELVTFIRRASHH